MSATEQVPTQPASGRCARCGEVLPAGAYWERLDPWPDRAPAYRVRHRRANGKSCVGYAGGAAWLTVLPDIPAVLIAGRAYRVYAADELDVRGRMAFFAVAVRFGEVNPLVFGQPDQDRAIAAMVAVFREFLAICVPDLPADTLAALTDDETSALLHEVIALHEARRLALAPA